MKKCLILPLLIVFTVSGIFADERGELIFQDDFERTESQEEKDEPGNGWGTNSGKRAKGNKQVDLRDGAMYIYIHEAADHGVSVTHSAEFQDGAVALKLMLENPGDSLGLNFADLTFKEVHAGHLCMTQITPKQVKIQDLKTGNMAMSIHAEKKAKTLTKAQKDMLATKAKTFPNKLEVGKWHDLLVEISGDTMKVTINGTEIGSFTSEGIAHPTKRRFA